MSQAIDKQGLMDLVEAPLRAMGYELVDLDLRAGRNGLVRLYIDSPAGVTLTDCERVSEQIGAVLDVEDPLPDRYTLEVSSPGFDRRLRTLEHFERFVGETVKIELEAPRDGRRRLTGRVRGTRAETIAVDVDGTEWHVSLDEIAMARLVPEQSKGSG